MFVLITLGRYFGKPISSEKIYCPHEKCIRIGERMQYQSMVGVFFVPIIPVATVKDWRCSSCNGRVVPNEGGKHSKSVLLFSSIVAIGGFAMFALFAYAALTLGGKNSMFDPGAQKAARWMAAFMAFLGFCIVARALLDAGKLAKTLGEIVTLSPEKLSVIDETLQDGDNPEIIASKLIEKDFSDPEIRMYLESWCKPER